MGNYYLRQRYYNSEIGRFFRKDEYEGIDTTPVSLHKYVYANDDPINLTDPTGWFSIAEVSAANTIRDFLSGMEVQNGSQLLQATLNGGTYEVGDLLFDIGITVAVVAVPFVAPIAFAGLAKLQRAVDARHLASAVDELRLTNTVATHLNEFTIRTAADGSRYTTFDRPFINSPLLYEEIIKSRIPVPDPRGVQGALRWDVPGSYRGKEGTWELVIDKNTKTVLHFNFTT